MNMHIFSDAPARQKPLSSTLPVRHETGIMTMAVLDPGQTGVESRRPAATLILRPDGGVRPDPEPEEADFDIRYFVNSGYRQNELTFNIASPSGSPDVLSKLKWRNLDIWEIQGEGVTARFGGRYALTRARALVVNFDYRSWWTDAGKDTVYPTGGGILKTRLNEVKWESWSANLGLQLRF